MVACHMVQMICYQFVDVGDIFTKILAERTRQFSKELNKSLNDEGTLDELLDAVIMAEQDVMVSF